MAEEMLKKEKKYIGEEVAEEAIKKIKGKGKGTKEGGEANEQKTTRRTRKTK